MSRNYKFYNPNGLYFVSFAVVYWLDVFSNNKYKDILVESLRFCQNKKAMEIVSWCIMTNHVHLIFRIVDNGLPQNVLGDFKRYTSKAVVSAIRQNEYDLKTELYLSKFREAALNTSNVMKYQFWRHDNRPCELWSNHVIQEKLVYVHNNPVEAGLVFNPEDYLYSSAKDYAGEEGLIKDISVFRMYS